MDLLGAQQQLLGQLKERYDEREAAAITDLVMEKTTGLKKMDRILRKHEPLAGPALEALKRYTSELLMHRPVQYVLQESWFCGLPFYVDEHVLIPRPETEELVEWLLSEIQSASRSTIQPASRATTQSATRLTAQPATRSPAHSGPAAAANPYSLLDICTGSGCIAIALYKKLSPPGPLPPAALNIYACDISAEALAIARRNAAFHQASIDFRQLNFLDRRQWENLPAVQAIISNPPYIPFSEKSTLAPHVVGFEPHLALFVEDKDPLVFYRSIAAFGKERLLPGGSIFVEIHEALATPTMQVFREAGFPIITLKKDMQGCDRMIKATW